MKFFVFKEFTFGKIYKMYIFRGKKIKKDLKIKKKKHIIFFPEYAVQKIEITNLIFKKYALI